MNRTLIATIVGAPIALASMACGSGDVENPADSPYTPLVDPANFSASTVVDNVFFPLEPGTKWVYEGDTDEGRERIEVFVTADARRVMGIDTVVVRDTVFLDGELVEDTFDWYAQDNRGNVWYMGEDSKEFEDGEFVSAEGSWEAGVAGALPGIIMLADPLAGLSYRQEFFEGEAEDMAEVRDLNGAASVPYGTYDGVLVIKEWNPLEPGVVEFKYYVRGLGKILEEETRGGSDRFELVEVTTQ